MRGVRYFAFIFENLFLLTKRRVDATSSKKSLNLEVKCALTDLEEANVSATFPVAAADLKIDSSLKKKGFACLLSLPLFISLSLLSLSHTRPFSLIARALSLPLSLSNDLLNFQSYLTLFLSGGSNIGEPMKLLFGKAEEERKYIALLEKERERRRESVSEGAPQGIESGLCVREWEGGCV